MPPVARRNGSGPASCAPCPGAARTPGMPPGCSPPPPSPPGEPVDIRPPCTSVAPPIGQTSSLWMTADGPICNRRFCQRLPAHVVHFSAAAYKLVRAAHFARQTAPLSAPLPCESTHMVILTDLPCTARVPLATRRFRKPVARRPPLPFRRIPCSKRI